MNLIRIGRDNFCHYVHFFSSAEAGGKWTAEHPGTFIMSIDDAYNLARVKNETQYRDVLGRSGRGEWTSE